MHDCKCNHVFRGNLFWSISGAKICRGDFFAHNLTKRCHNNRYLQINHKLIANFLHFFLFIYNSCVRFVRYRIINLLRINFLYDKKTHVFVQVSVWWTVPILAATTKRSNEEKNETEN